jgi:hypothetical protein
MMGANIKTSNSNTVSNEIDFGMGFGNDMGFNQNNGGDEGAGAGWADAFEGEDNSAGKYQLGFAKN